MGKFHAIDLNMGIVIPFGETLNILMVNIVNVLSQGQVQAAH